MRTLFLLALIAAAFVLAALSLHTVGYDADPTDIQLPTLEGIS